MHAAAVCGERTVKFLAENPEAPYEGVRVISLQCRMEKGKLLYPTRIPLTRRGTIPLPSAANGSMTR